MPNERILAVSPAATAAAPATGHARLSRRERRLCAAFALLLLAALLLPPVSMGALAGGLAEPHFADQRGWLGLPHAMDVLSNLPFALIGVWGLRWLHRFDGLHAQAESASVAPLAEPPGSTLDCAWLFFSGLIVTAAGSAFYHLQPDAARLAADRAGMAIAFAGLVGLAVCERVSQRAGWLSAWFVLAGGLLAVAVCHESGNVLPWGVVQFGGMALVAALAASRSVPGAIGVPLARIVAIYAIAKGLEWADHGIYEASAEWISGHSLKHLVAALAALPVLGALHDMAGRTLRHNPDACDARGHASRA